MTVTTATLDLGIDRRELSDRQAALLERAARLSDDFATRAEQHDREASFPYENFQAMHDAGYMKQCLPAEFGGEEVTLEELCLTQERLAWGDASTALGANMHSFFCGVMTEGFRQDPSDQRWPMLFTMVSQGKTTLGGAISERDSSDPLNFPSGTVERVDGGYRLNGMKVFGSNSAVSPMLFFSGWIEEGGEKKVLSFQVPKGTPGAEIIEDWDTLGMRATGSYTTVFKDCVVPELFKTIETPYGGAFGVDAFQASFLCWFEPTVASVYTGIAVAARNVARDTVMKRARLPFGEVKHYPSVQYGMAEITIGIESARAFIRQTAQRLGTPERRSADDIALAIATKVFATEQAARVVDTAMQVVGGGAFFKRSPLERMYRDVRAGKIHPPSHYDALEIVGKSAVGITGRQMPRFL
jgi:alkylation response protein AidB-like acyl-CoA dehydrogenase